MFKKIYLYIIAILLVLNNPTDVSAQVNIYGGGSADGHAMDTLNLIECPSYLPSPSSLTNIYGGGNADGHAWDTLNLLNCPPFIPSPSSLTNIYGGGIADGHAWDTLNLLNCPPFIPSPSSLTNIYGGGIADGHSVSDSTACIPVVPLCTVTANAGSDTTICDGESVTLTATGGSNYLWSTGATTASIIVSPSNDSTYIVTVSSALCSEDDTVEVIVNPSPTASISGTNTICNGDTTTLTAAGGVSYLWSTTETTAPITVSPASSTTYSVTVTNAFLCTDTTSETVTVNPLPTPAITGTDTICLGVNTTFTASGGTSYLWSTGATTASIVLSPPNDSTYSVTVTNAFSCTDTTSRTIIVNPLPTAIITGGDTICNGDSIVLKASGGVSYLWNTTSTLDSIKVGPTSNTTYSVTATNAFSCTDVDSKTITVITTTAGITGTTSICAGDNTTLTASGGLSYLWNTTETTAPITVSPASSTTYFVTVTGVFSCTDTISETVTVNPLPTAAITGTDTICFGDNTVLTASGGTSYLWSTTETTAPITVSPANNTTYSVTVTDAFSCEDTTSITIAVIPPTIISATSTTICSGSSSILTAIGGHSIGTSYLWSTTETTVSVTVSPVVTTDYSVTITDAYCSSSDTVTITVNCDPVNIYGGGIADGDAWGILDLNCPPFFSTTTLTNIYGGGIADGHSMDIMDLNCPSFLPTYTSADIYGGGISDGHSTEMIDLLNCPSYLPIYATLTNIYGGGIADGFAHSDSTMCVSTILPIELLYFSATLVDNNYVLCEWTTVTEINNDYFTVEKTTDGTNFEFVANVDGAGNSSAPLLYNTFDNNPYLGTSYYRLKQTDFNGEHSYSDLKPINLVNGLDIISISPNPSADHVNILFYSSVNTTVDINLYNVIGQSVTIASQIEIEKGVTKLRVDVSSFSMGYYMLEVATESGLYNSQKKLTKK